MQCVCVNAEYSIHSLCHGPIINCFSHPAVTDLSSPSLPCCSQLSKFPKIRVSQWIESRLKSQLPTSLSRPDQIPPSSAPISNHPGVELQPHTHLIMASKSVSLCPPIAPPYLLEHCQQVSAIVSSNSISYLARPSPPYSPDYGLPVYLQSWYVMYLQVTASQPPSASPQWLDCGPQVSRWATPSWAPCQYTKTFHHSGHVDMTMAWNCISILTRLQTLCSYLCSLHLTL